MKSKISNLLYFAMDGREINVHVNDLATSRLFTHDLSRSLAYSIAQQRYKPILLLLVDVIAPIFDICSSIHLRICKVGKFIVHFLCFRISYHKVRCVSDLFVCLITKIDSMPRKSLILYLLLFLFEILD